MTETKFDLVIIGSGPGGYVAAIRAAQLGMKVAVVERERLGGVCLNWGCIPTKALLRVSEIFNTLKHLDEFGLSASNISHDIKKIVKRSRDVADQLSNGVKFLFKKNKIALFEGEGSLAGSEKVSVTKDGKTQKILTKNIILATGARARTLPNINPDGKFVWTYKEALIPSVIPKSLLVIGSGAIGMEFASFFNTFGAKTTVIEMLDHILPLEDEEISAFAEKAFKKQGMTLKTKTKVEKLRFNKNTVTATVRNGAGKTETVNAERVILAVGIVGNTENLGLEEAGVKVEKTHVVINEWGETAARGVHAIGDLVGPPWLAHKAMHEGVVCVEKIAGLENVHPVNTKNVPGCTYCRPQVASVGLTEAAAKEAGRDVRVGRFPFIGNGKAITLGEPEGLIKTVFDAKSGELLGAHMIGAEVTELIQGYTIAKTIETTEAELMETIFPHPTISEAMHEAVLDAYGRVLHI